MTLAVDLFAGPGGWDVAARDVPDLETIGLEFDKWACMTRRAAGLATVEGDVRAYGPADFPTATGLIASPPCQTFSLAGKGAGRAALDVVLGSIEAMYWRTPLGIDIREGRGSEIFSDERTALVLEPLRWALDAIDLGTPYEWLAFEQVPTVLPVWVGVATVLRRLGYNVAVGNVQAEQYGVPQTRKRAILVAHLNRAVALPTPTHSKYHNRDPKKLDEGVLKWVSMAEALGWTDIAPSFMRSNYGTGGDASNRGERQLDQPAPTVTSKVDRNVWCFTGNDRQPRATVRPVGHPAPTITGGHDSGNRVWQDGEVSIKVTAAEAACLQSFPHDHPWAGGKGKQFQQIGNAIPPGLAAAILQEVCK